MSSINYIILQHLLFIFQEEGWAVCRVFKKRLPTTRRESDHDAPCWYVDDDGPFMHDLSSPIGRMPPHHSMALQEQHLQMLNNTYKRELKMQFQMPTHPAFSTIPHDLESTSFHSLLVSPDHQINVQHPNHHVQLVESAVDQVADWRVLDKFVASQLSHDATKQSVEYADGGDVLQVSDKHEVGNDYASTSTSSSQVDPWK
jgi:hypothetical protein